MIFTNRSTTPRIETRLPVPKSMDLPSIPEVIAARKEALDHIPDIDPVGLPSSAGQPSALRP